MTNKPPLRFPPHWRDITDRYAGKTCAGEQPTTQQEPADGGCTGSNCAMEEPAAPQIADETTEPAPTKWPTAAAVLTALKATVQDCFPSSG